MTGKLAAFRYPPVAWAWVTVATLVPATAAGQDTNYWSAKFGTRAILLGGAVIGSPVDLSATFYNPGGVALELREKAFLTSKTFEYAAIEVEDAAGQGLDFTSRQTGILPSFLAGFLPRKWLGEGNILTYSLLERFTSRFEVDSRTIDSLPAVMGLGTDVDFFGEAAAASRINEVWGGIGWARKVENPIGLGVTMYGAFRNQKGRTQVIAQALSSQDTGAALTSIQDFNYWNFRLVWKAGVMYDGDRVGFGVSITTPGLSLFGSGSALIDEFLLVPEVPGDTLENRFVAVDRDGGSTYASPVSVGVGLAYKMKRTRLFGSAEWYDHVGPNAVLDLGTYVGQSTGDTAQLAVIEELKSVVAWAVGVQHALNDKLSGYLSFAYDPAAAIDPTDSEDVTAIGNWNISVITAGATFPVLGTEFTLGLGYGFGSGTSEQLADFSKLGSGDILPGPLPTPVRYNALRLTIGFAL